jgi:hypothetical protein
MGLAAPGTGISDYDVIRQFRVTSVHTEPRNNYRKPRLQNQVHRDEGNVVPILETFRVWKVI